MKKLIAFALIIPMLLVFGCGGIDNRLDSAENDQESSQYSNVHETVRQMEGQEELVLSFVGDVMFDMSVASYIKSKGEEYIFQGYEKYFKSSDIVFGNLETAISSQGLPIKDKQYTFRSNPKLADFLKKYNFTVLSIANNHTLDYGPSAFVDTMEILKESGISYGGGGYNKQEASNGVVVEKKGLKIGFIAFTGVTPNVDWYAGAKRPGIIGSYKVHEAEVLKAVSNLRPKCDVLVTSLHWGKEKTTIVRQQEIELAHKLIDSGVDVIMGHHPHVVQRIEMYKGKPIFYSLGNFIFTNSKSDLCNKTIMATIVFDSKGKMKSVEAIPGEIKLGRPVPMEGAQRAEFIDYLNKMNIDIKL